MSLPPRHLPGVEAQVRPADVVVLADLGPAQAREERFGLVGACLVGGVSGLVVDPLHLEAGVQGIPMSRLVGVEDAA